MKTVTNVRQHKVRARGNGGENAQLFIQLLAVDNDTPLLRIESGKTSLGRIQPMGPYDMP